MSSPAPCNRCWDAPFQLPPGVASLPSSARCPKRGRRTGASRRLCDRGEAPRPARPLELLVGCARHVRSHPGSLPGNGCDCGSLSHREGVGLSCPGPLRPLLGRPLPVASRGLSTFFLEVSEKGLQPACHVASLTGERRLDLPGPWNCWSDASIRFALIPVLSFKKWNPHVQVPYSGPLWSQEGRIRRGCRGGPGLREEPSS